MSTCDGSSPENLLALRSLASVDVHGFVLANHPQCAQHRNGARALSGARRPYTSATNPPIRKPTAPPAMEFLV
eukprot:3049051-Amphidinium_carterae.1